MSVLYKRTSCIPENTLKPGSNIKFAQETATPIRQTLVEREELRLFVVSLPPFGRGLEYPYLQRICLKFIPSFEGLHFHLHSSSTPAFLTLPSIAWCCSSKTAEVASLWDLFLIGFELNNLF